MKNKIDKKVLFSIIIGIILSFMTSVLAETLVKSADVSYTDNAKLGANNVQDALDKTCTKFSNELSNFLNKIYPVGSIYISTANTNPSTFLGGTWENYADGRTLKGISSGQAGQTGGASTVALTTANLPAHTHTYDKAKANTDLHTLTINEMPSHEHALASAVQGVVTSSASSATPASSGFFMPNGSISKTNSTGGGQGHSHPISTTSTQTGSVGSGTSFSVQDPYITVYIWRRTK